MPVVFFRCSKCKTEFARFKDAKACEHSHLVPTSATVLKYTIRPFPYSIEVTFNNGEKRIYNAQDLGG